MRLIVGAVCALALAGCGGGNKGNNDGGGGSGGSGGGVMTLKPNIGLDLAHISGFAISGGSSAKGVWPEQSMDGGVTSNTQTLYAIDDQGNFIETSLTTFTGDGTIDADLGTAFDLSMVTTTQSQAPDAIFGTPKHILFRFRLGLHISVNDPTCSMPPCTYLNKMCGAVIMRKSDGGLFCFEQVASNGGGGFAPNNVFSDGGDQLFLQNSSVVRVDMSGAMPQSTLILDDGGNVESGVSAMAVNLDADALVDVGPGGSVGTNTMRVLKQNGGLQNLAATGTHLLWLSTSGHDFYYISDALPPPGSPPTGAPVMLVARQADGSFVQTQQGSIMNVPNGIILATATQLYGWRTGPNPGETGIVEILGANQGTIHAVTGLNSIIEASGAASSVFVRGTDSIGNGGIIRVDVPAYTQTTVVPPGDFSLTAMTLSPTGDLTFAGLRNSDGKHVVGNVPAGSDTYTISSATAPTVTQLTRLN